MLLLTKVIFIESERDVFFNLRLNARCRRPKNFDDCQQQAEKLTKHRREHKYDREDGENLGVMRRARVFEYRPETTSDTRETKPLEIYRSLVFLVVVDSAYHAVAIDNDHRRGAAWCHLVLQQSPVKQFFSKSVRAHIGWPVQITFK